MHKRYAERASRDPAERLAQRPGATAVGRAPCRRARRSRVPHQGWRPKRRQSAPSPRRSRAFGPRHDRQAPPFGRRRAARRQSRSLSGPRRSRRSRRPGRPARCPRSLTAFQPPGDTPGDPRKIRKMPVYDVSPGVAGHALSRRPPYPRPRLGCNRTRPRALGGLLFPTDYLYRRATDPRSRQQPRMRTVAPTSSGIRTPVRSAVPAFQPCGSTPGYPEITCISATANAVSR